jgi:hypothetical protein
MKNMNKKGSHGALALLSFLFIASMALSSCGSGTAPSASSGAAMVAVLLTDGPTEEFSEVRVTISGIELLSGASRAVLRQNALSLDLLDLGNEEALVALSGVPAGRYEKVRLRVTDVQLFDLDGKPVTEPPVKLTGNGKFDLELRGPVTVRPGETMTVRLDFDAKKCLKLDKNSNMYVFRPVIFAEAETAVAPQEKFVRVTGTAWNIDGANGTFELRLEEGAAAGGATVLVDASGGSAFFAEFYYGSQAAFGDLREGGEVTVIGTMTADSQARIEAAVVEIGTFRKLTGTVISGLDPVSGQFGFLPDSGQNVADVLHIVIVQTGTGIYSGEGEALGAAALAEGTRVEVDGFLIRVDIGPNIINAAFISVETGASEEQALSGTLSAASMSAGVSDGSATAPCVSYAGEMDVLLITSNGQMASTEYVGIGELEAGEEADLYGAYDAQAGCFVARWLVVQREQ